jgi:F0F1-type ATP synthase membrane subunit b/b'
MTQDSKPQEGADPVVATDTAWLDGILLDENQSGNGDAINTKAESDWADPLALDKDVNAYGKNPGWLQKTFGITPKPDKEVFDLKLKIRELQAQLQILAARPSVYEMDDSELLAVAGEDAAIMVRATKAKSQSMLQEADHKAEKIRDEASRVLAQAKSQARTHLTETREECERRLEAAKAKADEILNGADEEAKSQIDRATREHARLLAEGELRLQEVRIEVDRMRAETKERSEEWIARSRAEAQAEAKSVLQDAYDERTNAIARLKLQSDRARELSEESVRVRRHLTEFADDLQQSLEALKSKIRELDERAGGIADQTETTVKNV